MPIEINDFSGNEIIETFDSGFPSGFGAVTPFTLNGLTFNNSGSGNGSPGMFLATLPVHTDRFANIPGTSGGPVYADNWTVTSLEIGFSDPVNRAGLLLTNGPQTSYRFSAFSPDSTLLGDVMVSMPAENQAVFAGLEFRQRISFVRIEELNGDNLSVTFFDDLRYESLPEPPAMFLFFLGVELQAC